MRSAARKVDTTSYVVIRTEAGTAGYEEIVMHSQGEETLNVSVFMCATTLHDAHYMQGTTSLLYKQIIVLK